MNFGTFLHCPDSPCEHIQIAYLNILEYHPNAKHSVWYIALILQIGISPQLLAIG